MRAAAIALVLLMVSTGCFRTHYANFSPKNAEAAAAHSPIKATAWRSFFLWGWLPGQRKIDARELCGAEEKIHSISTRRTFLQGLIAAFAGYYVNIYSPWNGAVYCTELPAPT